MPTYAVLAALLAALAVFTLVVVWRHRPPTPSRLDLEQVRGFAYVGAGALLLLAVVVVVAGVLRSPGQAEGLAVGGLFAYLLYQAAALVIALATARRR